MNEAAIDRLEFDKALDRLEGFCGSPGGRALVGEMTISLDAQQVRRRLGETSEARNFLEKQPPQWEFGALPDIAVIFKKIGAGALLEPAELHGVRMLLEFSQTVRDTSPDKTKYPTIAGIISGLFTAPDIAKEISKAVDAEGNVLDSASVELARARRRIRRLEQEIPGSLRTFANNPSNSEIMQERIVTVRNGRFVVPVRAERARGDRFVLQDRSASGSTSFVEPLQIVEQNNALVEERIAERNEILAILRRLTVRVEERADEIAPLGAALASLDLLLARGRLSVDMRGCEPAITGGDEIKICAGRHPLLEGNPVPIDISLGGGARALVLTGPNAGGKTVALKMVGLFQLMAQTGLHVPALDGTTLPVFRDIFAVIGDEQSIERSLSTFTSHLRDISEIMSGAGARCLVLIDEICSGTDPQEGTALSCSILKRLMDRGAVCMATSHHGGLKTFAAITPGAQNARVLFDESRGEPRFIVEIGAPGKSHALEIALRAGIGADVIEGARGYLDAQTVMAEKMIAELEHLKGALAVERDALDREKKDIEADRKRAERELSEAEKQRNATLAKAMTEAETLIEQTRSRLRALLDRAHTAAELPQQAAIKGEMTKIREKVKTVAEKVSSRNGRAVKAGDLKPDAVLILRDTGQQVRLISGPDRKGKVKVLLGDMPMTTGLRNLGAPDGPLKPAPIKKSLGNYESYILDAKDRARASIDIRGLRALEAIEVLENEILTLNVAGQKQCLIIHGIGTGALIKAVHEHLSSNSYVTRFEPAPLNQGGIGATIIFLGDD